MGFEKIVINPYQVVLVYRNNKLIGTLPANKTRYDKAFNKRFGITYKVVETLAVLN